MPHEDDFLTVYRGRFPEDVYSLGYITVEKGKTCIEKINEAINMPEWKSIATPGKHYVLL